MPVWSRGMRQRLDAITASDEPLGGFFRWARQELDADEYARIQRGPNPKGGKYLSFAYFAREKMVTACALGLDAKGPKRVLDLGCGPGHMLLICRYFGHRGVGLDMPTYEWHVYNRLCGFFGVEKVDHKIVPYEPLPSALGRFDLITGSRIKFDRHSDGGRWRPKEWKFFLQNLKQSHLEPGGKIYLSLIDCQGRNRESWLYLHSMGKTVGGGRGLLL
jgi:SAM-dependent methyltransferase